MNPLNQLTKEMAPSSFVKFEARIGLPVPLWLKIQQYIKRGFFPMFSDPGFYFLRIKYHF